MIRRPPRSTHCISSAASDVYKRQGLNDEIVAYCHVGIRSAGAVSLLRENGFTNVKNLLGGIDAWAVQVDLKMPRY